MYHGSFGSLYHLTCLVHGLLEQKFLQVLAAEEMGQLKAVAEPLSLLGGTLVADYGRLVVGVGH